MWSSPAASRRLALSLSRGTEQAGSPRLAPPPPHHGPAQPQATTSRQRWLPALQWVPASLASCSTHSHRDSWPVFLVGAEWKAGGFFCFLLGS